MQTDDVATVNVSEECFWGSISFVHYFVRAPIDGTWKIVNETFVDTGGEPPP